MRYSGWDIRKLLLVNLYEVLITVLYLMSTIIGTQRVKEML